MMGFEEPSKRSMGRWREVDLDMSFMLPAVYNDYVHNNGNFASF